MNLYFLVEGKRTEKKVYPAWLRHLTPNLKRVDFVGDVGTSDYFIFSGEGYPSLLDVHMSNAIKDYRDVGKYDYLVVCLDVDDSTSARRAQLVVNRADELNFPRSELKVITQDCCIETWFLGNRRAVSPTPNLVELNEFLKFYNVRVEDPERMGAPEKFTARSVFHSRYFRLVAQDKRFRYTKQYPRHVVDEPFLRELILRRNQNEQMASFGAFLDFCDFINQHVGKTPASD